MKKLLAPFRTASCGVFAFTFTTYSSLSSHFLETITSLLFSAYSSASRSGGGLSLILGEGGAIWDSARKRWILEATTGERSSWWIVGRWASLVCSIHFNRLFSPSEYCFGSCAYPPCTIFKAKAWRLPAENGGCSAHSSKSSVPNDQMSVLNEYSLFYTISGER